jgi:hypothetical protein
MAEWSLTMAEQKKESTSESGAARAALRKPYETPALRVYGDVAALTRSVSNTSANADGGHGSMSKTS